MTLPWLFTPTEDNQLKITPVEELKNLRYDEKIIQDVSIKSGNELIVNDLSSDCMEAKLSITTNGANQFGFKLLCSPDNEEETIVKYDFKNQVFIVDYEKASNNKSLKYQGYTPYFPNKTANNLNCSQQMAMWK